MHLYIKSLPFSLLKREIYIIEGLCTVCVTYLSPLKVKSLRGKQRVNGVKISMAEVSPARPRTTHAMPLYLDRRTPAGGVCQHVARPTDPRRWGIFVRPFFSFGNINDISRFRFVSSVAVVAVVRVKVSMGTRTLGPSRRQWLHLS